MKKLFTLLFLSPLAAISNAAETGDTKMINFEDHIKPILREHCTSCHSESDKESDLALDSYGATLAGGSSGEVVVEGNSSSSRLFALVSHAERPFMPPDQDAIPKEQISLLKTWIEQGMPENSGSKIKRSNAIANAMLGTVSQGKPDGPPPMPEHLLSQPVRETARSAAIAAMAASPWAPLIAVGGQEQVVLYHAENGELLGVIPFPEGEPHALTFTRDGQQLLIAGGRHSQSGCAVLVDIKTGVRITKVGDELDIVLAADISPDKSRIALAGPQRIIRIYDSVSGELLLSLKKHTDWIFAVRYSPDGVLLASGDRSNGLVVWEADTGLIYCDLAGHKGEVRSVDFRADSNVLASGSLDGTIKLWDMIESKEIKSWAAHSGGVTAVSFAHDGILGSAGRDAIVKLWNGNGEIQKEFKGLTEAALEIALTGDAQHLAGGDWHGKIQLWHTADPEKARLIAANPPSLAHRIARSELELQTLLQQLTSANQAAEMASGKAAQSLESLTKFEQSVSTTESDLATATATETELSNQILQQVSEIQRLEELLVAARAKYQDLQTAHAESQMSKTNLQNQLAQLQSTLKQQQLDHQSLLQSAKETADRAALAKEEFAEVETALIKLRQEQAELDQRLAQVQSDAELAAAKVEALRNSLATVSDQEQKQSSEQVVLQERLASLQVQLAALQNEVRAVAEAQAVNSQARAEQQKAKAALAEQVTAAEQAAFEAAELLELYRQSYQNPE
ncbi:MAG: hypothetical protein KDB22_00805 [Planctomycetales bacterium]|nr:hypothetical protein [Planctomycetales bacterium]